MKRRLLAAAATAAAMVWIILAALAGGAATAAPAQPALPGATITQTVTLAPAKDNTLYESALGTVSNGAGEYLFAGTTQNGDIRRAVLAFDLSGIPAGATVLTATLAATMSRTIAGDTAVALHALAADWGEGDSDALGEEGAGAAAVAGDATWLHTFFDADLWAQPGGDFDPVPSATTAVGDPGAYTWASAALLADVAAWVADPATNFGWILIGDEAATGSAKRFDSRENEPANRPSLTITYRAVVEQAFVPAIFK